ncbi:MAG TPA: hypothetical protein VN207_02545 [Ktedonobacteraceae bacterium]|nr:hypothetical protein [Ktedonobacteraceae bacterium]
MATDQLKHAYEAAEKLSLKDQDMIAEKILEEIEDLKWDETLASPESQAYMEKMAAEIKTDIAAGRIIKYVPGKSLAELFQD